MKLKLDISMDSDATEDQLKIVQKAFGEYFDIDVKRNIFRRSASDDLPLLIAFSLNLVSAVSWDLIKLAAQSFFTRLPSRDAGRATIDIHQRGQRNVIISNSKIIIFNFKSGDDFPEEQEYDSIDQAIAVIKKLDEQ
jgi:hypothetical protein